MKPLPAAAGFVRKTLTTAELEVRKIRHEPVELLTRAVQPALWLVVFGQVVARANAIPTGNLSYLAFLAPGVLAQSVLFVSIFYGIAIIWERDLGTVQKLIVSPTPRAALVLGKALSAGVRGLSQAVVIYLLSLLLGIELYLNPLYLLGVILALVLGATIFATFSLIIATLVRTREAFLGIGQVLTLPLFFASNAIYPIIFMPRWLQVVALLNPLTYMVDALRTLMVVVGASAFRLGIDFAVLLGVSVVLVLVGGRLYPRVAM